MFRHPNILKYIEGNESENGVFYVRAGVVGGVFVQATELAIPLSEWMDYAKGKAKRSETDPLYAFLPNQLDKWVILL